MCIRDRRKAGLAIGQAGVQATEQKGASIVSLGETDIALPDLSLIHI